MRSRVAENSQEYSVLTHMLNQIRDAVFQVPLEEMNVKLRGQTEEVGMLTKAYESFSKGFMEAVNGQKSGFKQIEDIGKQSFGKLKHDIYIFSLLLMNLSILRVIFLHYSVFTITFCLDD